MGRSYYGDIEGKLGHQQESDGLSRFGGKSNEPQQIEYVFEIEDLETVEKEIEEIKTSLGEKIKHMAVAHMGGMEVPEHLNLNITKENLKEFQDFLLGVKILDCLKEKGSCTFTVDL